MLEYIQATGWLRETNYINGQWRGANDGRSLVVEDPATGKQIGTIARSGAIETHQAIDAAHAAFQHWSMTTAFERAELLQMMARLVRENLDDLAATLTLEQGKPQVEARAEITLGADYIQWFAEEARRINGEIIPSPWQGRQVLVTREPVGVVAAISPWNFPFLMLARKVAPALAAGCTIVVKPAELTPYSGLLWGVLAEKVGIPAGVVNVVTGDAAVIGGELTADARVRKLTFTGSTRVGKLLYGQSADTMKKLSLELGGNAPFIVFEDADIDAAIEGALASKYRNSGQTCICTNRFYVQDSIYDEFARRFAERVGTIKVGNGFDPDVQQGPLINSAAVTKVEEHLADAISKGGQVLVGGKPHSLGATFFEPTVIANAADNMLIAHEETFGPVAALFRFKEEQEAIDKANATEFGLASYFYTRNLSRVLRVSRALESGMVGVNAGLVTTEVAPFGGVKQSGLGSEGSSHGIEEYLHLKYINLGG
ncbi:NAD-dependent succinate-semialdehyde dehydrogenase [Pseudoalteromonas fenneropenaei]|uniref:NAD-dependent succinate-semialdehyde dehydrogenase n=1 Tax=Pseudoalteromonas fenneropenaei TaxID=1737459 RepID=A0ABV7CL44_9GAMM